jgi:hypothetical protein
MAESPIGFSTRPATVIRVLEDMQICRRAIGTWPLRQCLRAALIPISKILVPRSLAGAAPRTLPTVVQYMSDTAGDVQHGVLDSFSNRKLSYC